jgi:hypothetical protein
MLYYNLITLLKKSRYVNTEGYNVFFGHINKNHLSLLHLLTLNCALNESVKSNFIRIEKLTI